VTWSNSHIVGGSNLGAKNCQKLSLKEKEGIFYRTQILFLKMSKFEEKASGKIFTAFMSTGYVVMAIL
jgi:hypothetical protein